MPYLPLPVACGIRMPQHLTASPHSEIAEIESGSLGQYWYENRECLNIVPRYGQKKRQQSSLLNC